MTDASNVKHDPSTTANTSLTPAHDTNVTPVFHSPQKSNVRFAMDASPQTFHEIQQHMPSVINLQSTQSFSTPVQSPNSLLLRRSSPGGKSYREILRNQSIRLFVAETPPNANHQPPSKQRILTVQPKDTERLNAFISKHPELESKPSHFSYTITRNQLKHKKRMYKQKQITGFSARDFLDLVINELPENGRNYHQAHRQGHHLNGSCDKNNLDAATAGSNYTTLCYIESIASILLKNGNATVISISGQVEYDKQYPSVVRHIDYSISADNQALFTKRIEHLNTRKPYDVEHILARELSLFIIKRSTNSKTHDQTEDETPDINRLIFKR